MPPTLFRYPESMKRELEAAKMPYWSEGKECKRLSDALEYAKKIAQEKNFPIEVVYMGTARTVYPQALKDMGYY